MSEYLRFRYAEFLSRLPIRYYNRGFIRAYITQATEPTERVVNKHNYVKRQMYVFYILYIAHSSTKPGTREIQPDKKFPTT